MAAKKMQKCKLVSAAIDFGTTFSSWAFSFRHAFEKDPTDVSSRNWNDGSHISPKAPTTVLIRPDGHTLEAFGYDAENSYVNLVEEKNHEKFYLFTKFKMDLFQEKPFGDDLMIEDESAIGYLKDDLLASVNRQVTGGVTVDNITWVLTVPAIWTDSAKWFMRRAAEVAGICPENLRLSLEPEAASIFCRHMNVSQAKGVDSEIAIAQLAPGTKYIVLDAGGGTVDITVHRVEADGKIQEIYKASGGAWGGSKVNEAYQDLIRELVGENIFRAFKNEYLEYFIDLDRDFEIGKRKVGPDNDSKIRMKFPSILYELFKINTGKELVVQANSPVMVDKITLKMDKQIVHTETSRSLFEEVIPNITEHLSMIFADRSVRDTDIILMVGGFSESKMLQEAIRQTFDGKSIIVPQEAGLAVLKGAVIFGHNDMEITSRISKYTYGLYSRLPFDPKKHPLSRQMILECGKKAVDGVFSILVQIGDEVFPNKPCQSREFGPPSGANGFDICLYTSLEPEPQFVDDPGCVLVGKAFVDCRDKRGNIGGANVSLMFGGTEIEVRAVNNLTGETTRAVFKSI